MRNSIVLPSLLLPPQASTRLLTTPPTLRINEKFPAIITAAVHVSGTLARRRTHKTVLLRACDMCCVRAELMHAQLVLCIVRRTSNKYGERIRMLGNVV